jgi:hypothetical protein
VAFAAVCMAEEARRLPEAMLRASVTLESMSEGYGLSGVQLSQSPHRHRLGAHRPVGGSGLPAMAAGV